MIKDQPDLFAGRQENLHLFQALSERQAGKPWSFLPILSMIGPSGYGKSLFIHHLYFHYCNTPSLPHISLDFGRKNAPHDLLNILGALRNSLRRQRDAHGRALAFPRFDIIYARLKRSEGQEENEVDEVEELFGEFSDLIGLAANIHIVFGLLLFVLKFVFRIPPLRALLRWLVESAHQRAGKRPQWRWYQDQVRKFRELNLPDDAPVGKILERLNEMCTLGEPEREFLIEQILPKAFLADLRYGTYDNESSMLRIGPRYVVVFLDSFEVLLRAAESTARQLLEALALNDYRKRGESDPLLLIVASEDRLPDMSREQLNRHFPPDLDADKRSIQQRADALYHDWVQQLPPQKDRRTLRLRDIYLPLPFSTLALDATRSYLLRLDQLNETSVFTNEALIEDIHRVTQGYPIFLERLATTLQASLQNVGLGIRNLDDLFASEQGEQMIDRLLALHCKKVEERLFTLSAIPQTLTPELLGVVLERFHARSPDASVLNEEWQRYRHLPFLLASGDKQRVTFVPGIRALFLKKLQMVTAESGSDYLDMHRRLYDYFSQRIEESLRARGAPDKRDILERSYHALALGQYQPVIQLVIYAQQNDPDLWDGLLKVIVQAPTEKLPSTEIKRRASEKLYQAQQHTGTTEALSEAVHSIVFYTWLLAAPGSERKHASSLWYELGTAYQCLRDTDSSVLGDTVTHCFQRANELLDPPARITGILPQPGPILPPVPATGERIQRFIRSTYRSVRANRTVQVLLSIVLIGALLTSLLVPRLLVHSSTPPVVVNPFALPLADLQPDARHGWIGTTVEPDGEFVGLSDGSVPFDYLRPDGLLKIRAANQLRQGNIAGARTTLQQAVQGDVNDAEALIYLQDMQVRLLNKPCAVFVVVTRIIEDSSEGVNNGRANLQGAYVAQKEYNDANPQTPICLSIANLGNNAGYEPAVAQQLVNAAAASKGAIKGLIGWPGLLDSPTTLAAVQLLELAHLPIVSPDSYDEVQFVANVFHVAPSRQDQGRRVALYAEHVLQMTRAVIITDPANQYSRSLTEGFEQQFEGDGKQIVGIETYVTGQTPAPTLAAELQDALTAHPDFIYFTGGIEEGSVLLAKLRDDTSPIRLLGSEQLYPLVGFSANTRPDFARLAFTSAAYADAPTARHMKDLYALDFDPQDPDHVREYGYSRPDSDTILSYDAMNTLITAYVSAAGLQSVLQILPSVRVGGASRQVLTFTSLHELGDQHLFMLSVNQQEQIRFTIV